MRTSYIGTALTPTGRRVAVGTDRSTNTVADAETWEVLARWRGAEVTACGTIGDQIVCPALDGAIFLVDERGVDRIVHADKKAWFYAVAPTGPTTGLIGGSYGRLFHIDVSNKALFPSALRDFGVEKPGRDIFSIHSPDPIIITGRNELILRYDNGKCTALATKRHERLYYGAIILGDDVWVSTTAGAAPLLARAPLSGGEPVYYPLPLEKNVAAKIASYKGQILLVSDRMMLGSPDNWTELPCLEGAMEVHPDERSNRVFIVGYDGVSQWVSMP